MSPFLNLLPETAEGAGRPLYGRWAANPKAKFLATIDLVDLWRHDDTRPESAFTGFQGPHGACGAFNDKTPRHLLPAGPIGDYIHSYRQLIR